MEGDLLSSRGREFCPVSRPTEHWASLVRPRESRLCRGRVCLWDGLELAFGRKASRDFIGGKTGKFTITTLPDRRSLAWYRRNCCVGLRVFLG